MSLPEAKARNLGISIIIAKNMLDVTLLQGYMLEKCVQLKGRRL